MGNDDLDLLVQIEGIGPEKANRLVDYFGSGQAVAVAACSGWGEITAVRGIGDAEAEAMFHRMKDAEVFHDLRGY